MKLSLLSSFLDLNFFICHGSFGKPSSQTVVVFCMQIYQPTNLKHDIAVITFVSASHGKGTGLNPAAGLCGILSASLGQPTRAFFLNTL